MAGQEAPPVATQRVSHVGGLPRRGEDAPAPLDLRLHSVAAQQGAQLLPEEAVEGVAQELPVAPVVLDEGLDGRHVRDVAALLPADQDLLSSFAHLLEEQHAAASLGGSPRSHKPGGTCAYDDNLSCHLLPLLSLYSTAIYYVWVCFNPVVRYPRLKRRARNVRTSPFTFHAVV